MKKIGIIIPSLSDGGAEKVAANLSIIYKELGYEVYIILYENRVSFEHEGTIIDLNIKQRTGVGKIFKDYEIYSKLKKVKKEYDFDVVISHLPKTDLLNCLTKKNEKIITTIHNNIDIDYPNYMQKLFPYIIKKADLIASVSKVGEKCLVDRYGAKNVRTIYNPQLLDNIIDRGNEKIDEISEEILNGEIIVNIGRVNIQKGQWHLIRAFSELVKNKPNAKLLLIGQGILEVNLKNLVKNLNIAENVLFLGFNKNPYKFIKQSNLYVGTSLYEGFGMTLVEAMTFGVPVISTDCISGPREIIAPELFGKEINYDNVQTYGILVENFGDFDLLDNLKVSDSEKALAKKIEYLLDNKEIYNELSLKVKERSKDFDYKNIKKIWKKELDNLLGENNG
ncbi:glycosyltransferase [uncultured Clostridium sp.]|jgi:glycosyltransferase involved in cell wall biosynthesis|uniref:glycosyltransferase n=1 Tax=uncultured Clostridium sp. TaxID=59620 RepID=UPI002623DA59|nr:glycosyltransferase [uncultured Clostridium sp.]